MAHGISWVHPVRGAQVLFGIAVFGLIIYSSSTPFLHYQSRQQGY